MRNMRALDTCLVPWLGCEFILQEDAEGKKKTSKLPHLAHQHGGLAADFNNTAVKRTSSCYLWRAYI